MKMGITRSARWLLALPVLAALGCASNPLTTAERWANDTIGRAFAPKIERLAKDRDEAAAEVQSTATKLRAQELATGVQEGTPQWYENRLAEGQATIDQFAPVIADYREYREELLADDDLSEKESQALLQVTADLAAVYQNVISFNEAWSQVQAVAAEDGVTGLAIKAPAGSEYLLELTSVNQAPGFQTVNLAALPQPSNAPSGTQQNYVRSGMEAPRQAQGAMQTIEGRRREAQSTWDSILGIGR